MSTSKETKIQIDTFLTEEMGAQMRRHHQGRWYTFPSPTGRGFVRVEVLVRRNGGTDIGVDRGGHWLPAGFHTLHPDLPAKELRATFSHAVVPTSLALDVLRVWVPLELEWQAELAGESDRLIEAIRARHREAVTA